jgi:hypothetical protein
MPTTTALKASFHRPLTGLAGIADDRRARAGHPRASA